MTSTPAPPPPSARAGADAGRLRSLDGLRGVAALVVLVHHALFVLPVMARVQDAGSAAGEPWYVWALTHTPLHVLWAGEEAVLVFFVLSGLVLTLPAVARPAVWRSYYPRRLVRLYLPVWASVVVAVLLYLAVPRTADPDRSTWLNARVGLDVERGWVDALLVDGASLLNAPLWSLQWELVFSLLLPAFLLLGRARSGLALAVAVLGLVALVGVGTYVGQPALRYLPVFGLGVLMAFRMPELAALGRRVDALRRPRLAWGLVMAAVVVLLTVRWVSAGVEHGIALISAATSGATLVGAVLAVFVGMQWSTARAVLESRPVHFLGVISFSLYLVHEPVVVTLAFAVPDVVPRGFVVAAAIPLAIASAVLLHHAVEAPAHRLSRAVGHLAAGRAARPEGGRRRGAPSRHGRVAA